MRSRASIVFAVAIALALSVALPTGAFARPDSNRFSAFFSVQGSNGFAVSVEAWPHQIQIFASKGGLYSAVTEQVSYTAPATTSRTEIHADLGAIGSIAMQFHPEGRLKFNTLTQKGCHPTKVFRNVGTFVGSFRIAGEDEFTTAEADEVGGSVGTPNHDLCKSLREGDEHHPHHSVPRFQSLQASTANRSLYFSASGLGGHPRFAAFTALVKERTGPLKIFRDVRTGSASSFAVGPHLGTATVTPPAPFSGSAIFRRQGESKSPSWLGSLAVSFPGKPDVPLAGPTFTSVFLR